MVSPRLAVGRKAAAEPIVLAAPLQQPLQGVVGDAPVGIELGTAVLDLNISEQTCSRRNEAVLWGAVAGRGCAERREPGRRGADPSPKLAADPRAGSGMRGA